MEKIYPTGPITDLVNQVSSLQRIRYANRSRFETLTDREVQVLTLVAKGLNNADIAEQWGVARVTIQNHRSRLRDKLNITSQADYVKFALAYELIEF